MEYFGKTRKVGDSVVVTVPKSTNVRENQQVKVNIEVVE